MSLALFLHLSSVLQYGDCIFCSFVQCLVCSSYLILAFTLSAKQTQRLQETYLNSKILTEFPEGNIRLTKLKSPTYTLPSGPEARATGAKSLLLWAGPLQLVQATLRWCPLPIMVAMTGGCWEMNMFSPFPLCRCMPHTNMYFLSLQPSTTWMHFFISQYIFCRLHSANSNRDRMQ